MFPHPNPKTTLALHAKKYRIYSHKRMVTHDAFLTLTSNSPPFYWRREFPTPSVTVQVNTVGDVSGYVLSNSHDHSRR